MIHYQSSLDNISAEMLHGFFVGWPNPPSSEKLLICLENAFQVVVALETEKRVVVGFIYAISDEVLYACIPLLEVLPEFQGQGIGKELVNRMIAGLRDHYAIDLICDPDMLPFYQQLGFRECSSAIIRNYENQNGCGH